MKIIIFACLLLITYCTIAQTVHVNMLDTSFGKNGKIRVPRKKKDFANGFTSVLIQTDGKIIAAGTLDPSDKDTIKLLRFLSNGNIDSLYGKSGVVSLNYPGTYVRDFHGICLQSDGKVVGQAYFTKDLPQPPYRDYNWSLFRLTTNGKLDSSFGINGFVTTSKYPDSTKLYPQMAQAITVLPNNNIVVAGYTVGDVITTFGVLDLNVWLYDKDGKLLNESNYPVTKDILLGGDNMEIKYTSDGKLVIAFSYYNYNEHIFDIAVIRFLSNGKADPEFNNGKIKYINLPFFQYALIELGALNIDENNKPLIGLRGSTFFNIIRLKLNGSIDSSFATDGVTKIYFFDDTTRGLAYLEDIQIQKDNKLIAAGSVTNGSGYGKNQYALARFNDNGSVDSSFGLDGKTVTIFYPNAMEEYNFQSVYALAIQNDGRIVSVGQVLNRAVLSRYFPERISTSSIAEKTISSSLKTNKLTNSISPNPVKDVLNISSKNLSYKTILIIDASGKVVLRDGFAGSSHSINVSALSAGAYYINLVDSDGNAQSLKMIKQ